MTIPNRTPGYNPVTELLHARLCDIACEPEQEQERATVATCGESVSETVGSTPVTGQNGQR